MKVTPLLDQYKIDKIANLLQSVPLFDWILQSHPEQFSKLLPYCRLYRLHPGESIIKKGDVNGLIYIILKGGCFAYVDEEDQTPINQLGPNDMFGEIAAILEQPRTATIIANYDEPESLLLGIDFSIFTVPGTELDTSVKKIKYQSIQRTIFKRLRSVHRDLSDHTQITDPLPQMLQPPHYISEEEQLKQYIENCQEGARSLQQLSKQLAREIN